MARNSDRALTTLEVCDILKSCAENHVSSLLWRELEVTFHQSVKPVPPTGEIGESAAPLTQTQHDEFARQSIERDEISLREEQNANLPIESPLEYEEQLRGEDLEDDADDSE